jgi:hypothetical protein
MVDKFDKANQLVTYYQRKYKARYHEDALVARSKLKYPLADALTDFTVDQLKKAIDFYLATDKDPSLSSFAYDYVEIIDTMRKQFRGDQERRMLMEETKARVMKFRERYGKK